MKWISVKERPLPPIGKRVLAHYAGELFTAFRKSSPGGSWWETVEGCTLEPDFWCELSLPERPNESL